MLGQGAGAVLASREAEPDPIEPPRTGLGELATREQLEARWRAASELMADAGYDALLVAGRGIILQYGNVLYFGGFPLFLLHGYVLLIPDEPARLILNGRDQLLAEEYGVGDLVQRTEQNEDISYGLRHSAGLAEPISELLSQRGLSEGRVGVAGLSEVMPIGEYEALGELLPGLTLEEAGASVAAIKAVKSGAELKMHKQAAAMADEAFALFEGLVRPGANELDIVAELERDVRRRGVNHVIARVLPGLMDPRPPVSRELLEGELLTCYVEFVAPNGFWVEKGACFATGELPSRWEEVYEAGEQAFEAAEKTLTAGNPADLVAAAVWAAARESGCEIAMQIGHGVGIDHDLPLIQPGSEQELLEGMVVAIHPLVQDGSYGAFTIDQYTITAGEPERHSRFPRRLYRV